MLHIALQDSRFSKIFTVDVNSLSQKLLDALLQAMSRDKQSFESLVLCLWKIQPIFASECKLAVTATLMK